MKLLCLSFYIKIFITLFVKFSLLDIESLNDSRTSQLPIYIIHLYFTGINNIMLFKKFKKKLLDPFQFSMFFKLCTEINNASQIACCFESFIQFFKNSILYFNTYLFLKPKLAQLYAIVNKYCQCQWLWGERSWVISFHYDFF